MTARRWERLGCGWWRHRMDAAFVHGPGRGSWRRLRRHLERCAPCRGRFERLMQAARALAPGRPLAAAEVELIGHEVLGPGAPRRAWAGAGVGVLAAGAAAVLLLVLRPPA
ncbi:MAG: hypothetical protein HY906_13025, partial [Deltaproteobacteria bacterium]|nr:hypothetical protein [Deltaproteobacteria bacterium]